MISSLVWRRYDSSCMRANDILGQNFTSVLNVLEDNSGIIASLSAVANLLAAMPSQKTPKVTKLAPGKITVTSAPYCMSPPDDA